MESTEEKVSAGAGDLGPSYHAIYYPSACADHASPEDPGDLEKELEVVEPPDQPARIVIDLDPCEIARRALDLMFPREESDDDNWSNWSEREGSGSDDDGDHVQVTDEDEDEETDCKVDDCITEEGRDYEEDRCNVQLMKEETNCPGKLYPESEAQVIDRKWADGYLNQIVAHTKLCKEIMALGDEDDTPLPPHPMQVLPDATAECILGLRCYHRLYRTHDTSTTPSTLGHREPKAMLQIFSLRLSSLEPSCPTSVYGIFAVRDYCDRRRNYVFNRSRVDAVTIPKQDSFALPLCSPCRGMYVRDKALLEVVLWEKKEGDGSADRQLVCAYVQLDIFSTEYDGLFCGRISGDHCNLDVTYVDLAKSVEAVIQVYAKVDHTHHVRFTAFSTGYYGDGVVLFDDELSGSEKIFQHVVAVKANEKLDVVFKVDNSLFKWTFQDESVGPVVSPDDSIVDYGHFFVRVMFAPKDSQ